MSVKLTCPVCDRSRIETNTCPNCETNLTTYRMLAELPVETTKVEQRKIIPIWFPIGAAVLLFLLGISLGFAGNSIVARQQIQTTPTQASTTSSNPITESKLDESLISSTVVNKSQETGKTESKSCGGFNYVVRKGDSLSLIASRFYGNSNFWSLITEANSELQGRENSIEIDEVLLIPNRDNNCL